MNRFDSIIRPLKWLSGLLVIAFIAGCGGGGSGGGGVTPILGDGGGLTPATRVDVTKPQVTVTIPATTIPGPTLGVPANAAIIATFTKAMAPATLVSPATSFTLVDNATPGVLLGGNVTYIAASKIAKFKPTVALTVGNTYTATIKGTGASPATDVAGNPLAGNQAAVPAASDYIWTFTAAAADLTPPTITLENPADAATNVTLNASVNATFSEAIDPASITFTVQTFGPPLGAVLGGVVNYDSLHHIATFTPSVNLAANTKYQATVATATDLAGNALVVPAAGVPANPWTFTTGTALAPGATNLGSASTFGLMATAAITAASGSTINGDVSLEPGTSMTGFPPAIVNGSIHINDTVSHQARTDLLTAYNSAKALPPGTTIAPGADMGALYPTGMAPGTYTSGSTMLVATPLVLDAGGNANAVWVFQIGSSLTTNGTGNVTLLNGAQAKNVFWVPTLDATIGVGRTFHGTIVSGRDVSSAGGATINGRILAGATTAGTIALNGTPTIVNVPAP